MTHICVLVSLADLQLDSGTSNKSLNYNILIYFIQSTQHISNKVLVNLNNLNKALNNITLNNNLILTWLVNSEACVEHSHTPSTTLIHPPKQSLLEILIQNEDLKKNQFFPLINPRKYSRFSKLYQPQRLITHYLPKK